MITVLWFGKIYSDFNMLLLYFRCCFTNTAVIVSLSDSLKFLVDSSWNEIYKSYIIYCVYLYVSLVELTRGGSATNRATPSSINTQYPEILSRLIEHRTRNQHDVTNYIPMLANFLQSFTHSFFFDNWLHQILNRTVDGKI